ncbi:hypothetical protein MD484_g306, partial [Candolleomyces efflorescens]
MYSNGLSEIILGKAIKQFNLPRGEIVVMTKVFFPVKKSQDEPPSTTSSYINQQGLSRKHIFDSVKQSLERLQLDYIDVLQYYALTNNLTPFISMQNLYNLLYREEEREMMPTLKMFGVGCIPWSPLARGYLSRPYEASFPPTATAATAAHANLDSEDQGKTNRQETDKFASFYQTAPKQIIDRIEELAQKKNVPMSQMALAWLLSKEADDLSGVTAPIVGVTSIQKLEDLVGAIHLKLTPEEQEYLEEGYRPQATYGHN